MTPLRRNAASGGTMAHPGVGRLHVLLEHGVLGPLLQVLKQVHPLARLQPRLQHPVRSNIQQTTSDKYTRNTFLQYFTSCW